MCGVDQTVGTAATDRKKMSSCCTGSHICEPSCWTKLTQSYRNMPMVRDAAKGNNTSWLQWYLSELRNGEMFGGFLGFWMFLWMAYNPICPRQTYSQGHGETTRRLHTAGLMLMSMGLQQSFDFSDTSVAAFQGNKLPHHTQSCSFTPEGTIRNL